MKANVEIFNDQDFITIHPNILLEICKSFEDESKQKCFKVLRGIPYDSKLVSCEIVDDKIKLTIESKQADAGGKLDSPMLQVEELPSFS